MVYSYLHFHIFMICRILLCYFIPNMVREMGRLIRAVAEQKEAQLHLAEARENTLKAAKSGWGPLFTIPPLSSFNSQLVFSSMGERKSFNLIAVHSLLFSNSSLARTPLNTKGPPGKMIWVISQLMSLSWTKITKLLPPGEKLQKLRSSMSP